jgi:hypothetical protein
MLSSVFGSRVDLLGMYLYPESGGTLLLLERGRMRLADTPYLEREECLGSSGDCAVV